jgi:V8-like Glu-specific endopeptidase
MALFSSAAYAETPQEFYDLPGQLNPQVATETPGGANGTVGGDAGKAPKANLEPSAQPKAGDPTPPAPAPAQGAPLAKRTTKCVSRRRVRICKTKLGTRLLRSCTTRGSVKTCRLYDAATGRKTKVCVKRGRHKARCKKVRTSRAHAAALISEGYLSPTYKPVVRMYKYDYTNARWAPQCTGTLLQPGVILTAAHCVYKNGYYSPGDYLIVPANSIDANGNAIAPYGQFSVRDFIVPNAYKNNDTGQDWALMLTYPDSSGHYPGYYTGMYTAEWGARFPYHSNLVKVGYPAERPWDTAARFYGHQQYYCYNTWDGLSWNSGGLFSSSYALVTEPCTMNGGASGGPLFYNGTIIAVNNRASRDPITNLGGTQVSFYFDERFGDFWYAVQNYWFG